MWPQYICVPCFNYLCCGFLHDSLQHTSLVIIHNIEWFEGVKACWVAWTQVIVTLFAQANIIDKTPELKIECFSHNCNATVVIATSFDYIFLLELNITVYKLCVVSGFLKFFCQQCNSIHLMWWSLNIVLFFSLASFPKAASIFWGCC